MRLEATSLNNEIKETSQIIQIKYAKRNLAQVIQTVIYLILIQHIFKAFDKNKTNHNIDAISRPWRRSTNNSNSTSTGTTVLSLRPRKNFDPNKAYKAIESLTNELYFHQTLNFV